MNILQFKNVSRKYLTQGRSLNAPGLKKGCERKEKLIYLKSIDTAARKGPVQIFGVLKSIQLAYKLV